MNKIAKTMMLFCLLAWFHLQSIAADKATREDAVAFVKKGVEYYKKNGKEKALAMFNDPNGEFVKGELYFFVYGANGDGINLAHGQNPKMNGKNLLDMKDVNGVYLIREANKIAASAEGKGWISYMWPNSMTKQLEPKESYIEKVGDIWIGCGIYKAQK